MEAKSVERVVRTAEALLNKAEVERSKWMPLVELVMPEIASGSMMEKGENGYETKPLCDEARIDVMKLAGARMSYIFPVGQPFFRYAPWGKYESDGDDAMDADDWFARVSDIAYAEYERSNFQTAMNEVQWDSICTGTGAMLVEYDDRMDTLQFLHIPAGTYAIAEDASHNVTTVVRKFKYTAWQIADEFGEENMTPSQRAAFDDPSKVMTHEFEILHVVMPRKESLRWYNNVDAALRPWMSLYVDRESKKVLFEGGYYEFPYMVTRYYRIGNSAYGTGPVQLAGKTILRHLIAEDCQEMTAQRSAFPPIVAPAEMIDGLDLRPGAINPIEDRYQNMDLPRAFSAPVNYQAGMEWLASLTARIQRALHIDMLQIFEGTDRYMSATEVNARENEKIFGFLPSFTQMQADARSMVTRVFALLLRAGKFPMDDMPDGVVMQEENEDGTPREYVVTPKAVYVGKMAQGLERVQGTSADDFVGRQMQIGVQLQEPGLTNIFDWEKYSYGQARKHNVPAAYLKKPRQYRAEIQAMNDAIMQQQNMAAAANAADANLKNASADNQRMQYQSR